MAVIKHGKTEYPVPEGADAKDVFESLKAANPEMSNAKLTKDGSDWKVNVSYGKKG